MADGDTSVIALPAIFDLDVLDAVRDGLLDALEAGPVSVRADGVERVSTNALMLLMSAAETARRNAYAFAVEAPSAPILAAIERLGLTASFDSIVKG